MFFDPKCHGPRHSGAIGCGMSKNQQNANVGQVMRVFLRILGHFLFILFLFCSLDKNLKIILLICINDKYFGMEEVLNTNDCRQDFTI